MFATTLGKFDWRNLPLTPQELGRMMTAGAAWGLLLTAGLAGMKFWNYEMICIDDIAATTALSVAVGIFTIGPIAVYGRCR